MLRRLGMALELLELTVYRQEELRMRQRQHELLLLLTGVAGHMGVIHILVDDLCAQRQQTVDDLRNSLFIAGDGRAEMMMKSLGPTRTCRWLACAMRDSALSGSP